MLLFVIVCKLARTDSESGQCTTSCSVAVLQFAAQYYTSILAKMCVILSVTWMHIIIMSSPHYCLNWCSAVDNYMHAHTVNIRLSFFPCHQEPWWRLTALRILRKPHIKSHVLYDSYFLFYIVTNTKYYL